MVNFIDSGLSRKRPDIKAGSRVEVLDNLDLHAQEKSAFAHYIGERGIVISTDGVYYKVLLDNYIQEEEKVFFEDEIGLFALEGGDNVVMYVPINYKYILNSKELSAFEKLVYFLISEEEPVSRQSICETIGIHAEFANTILAKLLAKSLITQKSAGNDMPMYYPVFHLKQKKEKKEPQTDPKLLQNLDNDVLLMVSQLEHYYKNRGVSHKISKNGTKKLGKCVEYLNRIWKTREEHREFDEFEIKADLYYCFVEFAFKDLVDNELNHLKRLNYAGTKTAWRAYMKRSLGDFSPHLIDKSFSLGKFYGIDKDAIPTEPKDSGYNTTLHTFLIPKWKTKSYPVCPEVLYALEAMIIYSMFRKKDITKLKQMHTKYVTEYKLAEERDKLDNLLDFVGKNKKNSDYCHECAKKVSCVQSNSNAIVNKCSEKVVE
ncbi:MAG: hypothetical protein ACW99G_04990 [Candidatus Thorarchaeota archaeon]|jgi:hypothetical protein